MLTKQHITELKRKGDGSNIAALITSQRDVGSINFILESLGHLPENFNSDFLYKLLRHNHSQVGFNAVKNIGKLKDKDDMNSLIELYKRETGAAVRREIVSSIRRQRKSANKHLLFDFLKDQDPKIVCQAIRGLLVFERDKEVEGYLRPLVNHPNEMIRTIIYKEYFSKENKNKNILPHVQTYDFLKNIIVNADVL